MVSANRPRVCIWLHLQSPRNSITNTLGSRTSLLYSTHSHYHRSKQSLDNLGSKPSLLKLSHSNFDSAFDLAFDVKGLTSKSHTVLPIQTSTYSKVYPPPEDALRGDETVQPTSHSHLIHEAHMMRIPQLDVNRFKVALLSAVEEISILRSRITRNDRIIDADVEGFIESAGHVNVDSLLVPLTSSIGGTVQERVDSVAQVSEWLEQYFKSGPAAQSVNPVLRCFHTSGTGEASNKTFVVFITSAASMDHSSLSAVARYVLARYVGAQLFLTPMWVQVP